MALSDKLMKIGTMKKYNQDDYIFFEGDHGAEMFIILTGNIDIYINSSDSSQLKVSTLKPGSFFGEMSLFEDLPRSASAVAATDAVLLVIDKNNLLSFIKEQPDMTLKILKGLSSRVRSLNEEISKLKKGEGIKKNEGIKKSEGIKEPASLIQHSREAGYHELFPVGHKNYEMDEPDTFSVNVYEKELQCPLCNGKFKTDMQRITKLTLERVEKDFRKIYTGFDPLWYSIIVCPHCNYASYFTEFNSIPDKYYKSMKTICEGLKSKIRFQFTKPRNINQVFTSYYMAMQCAQLCKADCLKTARLWIQLSWLYNDMKDEEMYKMASENAYKQYYEVVYNSNSDISTEQEQTIFIILGEMLLKKGENTEAMKLFYKAINRKVGKPVLNKMAEDRIYELKHG